MKFCSLPAIDDPGLKSFINGYKRGSILDIDAEDAPETFQICVDTLNKIREMLAFLNYLMIRRERVRPIHFCLSKL